MSREEMTPQKKWYEKNKEECRKKAREYAKKKGKKYHREKAREQRKTETWKKYIYDYVRREDVKAKGRIYALRSYYRKKLMNYTDPVLFEKIKKKLIKLELELKKVKEKIEKGLI